MRRRRSRESAITPIVIKRVSRNTVSALRSQTSICKTVSE